VTILLLAFGSASASAGASRDAPVRKEATARSQPRLHGFERDLEELRDLLGIPGLSVAIVEDQRLLWAKGFGFADLERHRRATANTPFPIASVTKPVAATLLLQLVEKGLVGLDDPARKYSAEFSDERIRIRHLLTHTSEGVPGEKYAYNGDRFRALTQVIEKVSGKPFRQVLVENVLDRVGMSRSVPGHDVLHPGLGSAATSDAVGPEKYRSALDDLAKPYLVVGGRAEPTDYPPRGLNAAAGLISTVVDLAKLDVALDRRMLLKESTLAKAWTPAVSRGGTTLPYGSGWFVQRHNGLKLVWHYGYWQQFSALYLKVPERNLTLIVLANSNGLSAPFGLGDGDVLASPFASAFLSRFISGAPAGAASGARRSRSNGTSYIESRVRIALSDWRARDGRHESKVDPATFDAFVGEYEFRRAGFFTTTIAISRDGGKLFGSFIGENTGPQNRFELTPESASRFFWKGEAVTFSFIPGTDGKAGALIWREFGQERRLPRIR
jgi:CubicO group peptidase (beta-lactamase class C family)